MNKSIINRRFWLTLLVNLLLAVTLLSCNNGRRRHTDSRQSKRQTETARTARHTLHKGDKSVVKMRKSGGGVYYVPCKINDTEMEFVFDTGASDISMSLTEAKFLYKQGKLKVEDFRDTQMYQTADGSILEGMIVILRKVEIGGRELSNVQASIVNNEEAPLLLGQSALSAFGKISIDYNRNELTFE
jgi:aspartyl protease family protein